VARRIRSIKPEIIEDEKTGPLSDTAFRLFASMITIADDHGNVRADVRWLQAQIWWAHRETPNVLLALVELVRGQLIDVYGVRGGTYAHLRGWAKHQRVDNAGKSMVPMPNDPESQAIEVDVEGLNEKSPRVAASRREIPLDGIGEDGTRMGGGSEPAAKSPRGKSKRSSACPVGWSPRPEERAVAATTGLNCDAEAAHFQDHHAAKGSRFLDWDAAFRTWLRNGAKFAKGSQRQGSLAVGRAEPQSPETYQADKGVSL
jgi:hypothetical protein